MTTISPLQVLTALLCASAAAYQARKKGANPYLWFALGLCFGLIGLFFLFFLGAKKKRGNPQKTLPMYRLDGPVDKFWYYVDPQQERQGPLSKNGLLHVWKEGKLSLDAYVWHEELSEWKKLKELLVEDRL